jgi:hypothetical protein
VSASRATANQSLEPTPGLRPVVAHLKRWAKDMASDRPEVSAFFAVLHRDVFKPRGYTKLRHTFQKEEEAYAMAFQFQGSDWNSASSPWRFYLNAGLRFPSIPRRTPDRNFPTIHSFIRVSSTLSEWAEPQYDIIEEDQKVLVGKIASIVEDCRRYFAANHESLRQKYELKPVSYLGYLDEALMKR